MWIETYSGLRFDLLEPTPAAVSLDDIAHALAHVNRFTGHTSRPYSVAEHSLWVEWLVGDGHVGVTEPSPLLRLHALLHDAAEAYVGDLSRPMKEVLRLGRCNFKTIEWKVQRAIYEKLGLPPPNGHEEEVVERADMVALATERRALMPNTGQHAWDLAVDPNEAMQKSMDYPPWAGWDHGRHSPGLTATAFKATVRGLVVQAVVGPMTSAPAPEVRR